MIESTFLESERLVLEPVTPEHAELVIADFRDPDLYRFIPQDPPESLAWLSARYRRLALRASPDGRETWLNWLAREKPKGEFVGLVEVTLAPPKAGLAYFIFSRFQRRGYAREACRRVIESLFTDWNATVVAASIDTRNTASLGLIESLGFSRIAHHPNADFFKGNSSDEFAYELRRTEASTMSEKTS